MKSSLFSMAFALSLVLISGRVNATLGEKINSLKADRAQLKAVAKAQTVNVKGYTVDESTIGSGTIRQYFTSDGTIFAITWDDVAQPDLSVLLGSFNDRYVTAIQATPMIRHSRLNEIRAAGLVVRKSGHMRAWHGQIIATDLVPAGVTDEDIQ